MSHEPRSSTNALLGFPADARLLLVNADDFGMYDSINDAVVTAFKEGMVRSTSLMVPCPGAERAMHLLQENPDLPFAVHLSVIRDIDSYDWGPLAPREDVPSLLDGDGKLFRLERMAEMLAQATLDDLETEFRAQIDAVLASGLTPTHLDWHCLDSGGRPDVFAMTLRLAREYGLALRVGSQPFIAQVQRQCLPCVDHDLLDSFSLSLADKSASYAQMLRDLPAGLTEWAVHPSLGTPLSQSIDPDGWQVRRTDFDFLISDRAREIIEQEGITLIDYRPLQRIWQPTAP